MLAFNEKQEQKATRDATRRKLIREQRIKREIKALLKNIADDGASLFVTTGQFLDMRLFFGDISKILKDHYRRVINDFGFQIRKGFKLSGDIEKVNLDFARHRLLYINNHSEEQAKLINDTNSKILQNSIEASLLAEFETITEQAKIIESNFNNTTDFRANAIAITETNNSANWASETEVAILQNNNVAIDTGILGAGIIGSAALSKIWKTVGDDRVRPTHVQAEGQKVGVMQSFSVGGFQMRHPSDSTLGAPISEIANCRCSMIFGL